MQVVELVNDLILGDQVVVSDVAFQIFFYGHAVAHDALQQFLFLSILAVLLWRRMPRLCQFHTFVLLDSHLGHALNQDQALEVICFYQKSCRWVLFWFCIPLSPIDPLLQDERRKRCRNSLFPSAPASLLNSTHASWVLACYVDLEFEEDKK